jgi:hypothetical protein
MFDVGDRCEGIDEVIVLILAESQLQEARSWQSWQRRCCEKREETGKEESNTESGRRRYFR